MQHLKFLRGMVRFAHLLHCLLVGHILRISVVENVCPFWGEMQSMHNFKLLGGAVNLAPILDRLLVGQIMRASVVENYFACVLK